jgi:CheY-like chemotaxis protein
VFGFVRQSGGHIWVDSEPARGTVFKIYLPEARALGEVARLEERPASTLRGSETVLLVEDEEQLRSLARLVLLRHGYRVLTAQEPREAILIAEQHPGEIQLLLTDVVMPKMDGRRLAERLAAARPNLCVLLMSGYAEGPVPNHPSSEPGRAFIAKPFTPEALLRAVRALLDPA